MATAIKNTFGAESKLATKGGDVTIYRLSALAERGVGHVDKLPFSIKVLMESALRNLDELEVQSADILRLGAWSPATPDTGEIPFKVSRVILQDFTGVPCVVDLAS